MTMQLSEIELRQRLWCMSGRTGDPLVELRTVSTPKLIRSEDKPIIVGHAAVFNTMTDIGGYYREKVAPGAFARAIKEDDVRALFNHNPDLLLGRNKAGTLRLSEDDQGLAYEVDPDMEISHTRDVVRMMERGDVTQSSFGFFVRKQQWEEDEKGIVTRTIIEAELFDVSPVTYPAYTTTDVGLRQRDEWRGSASYKAALARMRVRQKFATL
jgi:HK97 family phage prohead protease